MGTYGGIDLGGTKIQAIVIQGDRARIIGEARHPTPREGGPDAVVAAVAHALEEAAVQAGIPTQHLDGVGIGSPGEIDAVDGTVAGARNLPCWDVAFPLAAALSERVGTKVHLGNDVDVATSAEFQLGAGRHVDSLLGVFWGTGVGGGLVLGGRPWHGRGGAGEIGHMVIKRGGARCPCGRRGCVEAYAGRHAMEAKARSQQRKGRRTVLFELMEEHRKPVLTSGIWARALQHHDALAEHLIQRAVEALGAGIASAVNLLDVELVLLGGGLGTRFGESIVQRITHAARPHLFDDQRPPAVRLVELGDLGGAIGASLLCDAASRPLAPGERA
ncbi:MAG: ROK family protein [Solirubrobacteraceae bacterium]